jgi:hypothetical protein
MEQRAVVHFFTLKGLSPKDVHTELESAYVHEGLCLRPVYRWHKPLMHGRTKRFHDPRSGRSLQNDLADSIRTMIQEFTVTLYEHLCGQFRLARSTCLRLLYGVLCLIRSIYDVSCTLWTTLKTPNRCHFPRIFEDSQRRIKERICSCYNRRGIMILFWLFSFIGLCPAHRWGSRMGQPKSQTEKYLISVISFVKGIHSLLDVPKQLHIIVHSSLMSLYLICWKTYAHISEDGPCKESSCWLTMHIFTIQRNLRNVSQNFVPG